MITITQTVLQPQLQVEATDDIRLHGWYMNSFIAADGITPVQGGNGQTGFFYDILCSLNDDGLVVIPAFDLQETALSNPTAGFVGWLYVNNSPVQCVFGYPNATAGWQIPAIYGAIVSFDQIARYNAAVQLLYAPNTFFTANQTIAEIQRIAGELAYAGLGVAGVTQLSIAPDNPAIPIAFGANDPAVGNLSGAVSADTVPRGNVSGELTDGLAVDNGTDFGVQTLGYFQAGDYQLTDNGSRIEVNDGFGLAKLLAAANNGNQYAGLVASATDSAATIEIQATSYSYLKNSAQGIVSLGDGDNGNNGTMITIDDVNEQISLTRLPTSDPQIANVLWRSGNTVMISTG